MWFNLFNWKMWLIIGIILLIVWHRFPDLIKLKSKTKNHKSEEFTDIEMGRKVKPINSKFIKLGVRSFIPKLESIIESESESEIIESESETESEIYEPVLVKDSKTKSIGEHLTCEALRCILKTDIKNNIRPKFLTNPKTGYPLEIDCWSEEYGIGVEYNGIQHYEYPSHFSTTEENFEEQLYRDNLKKELADKNGTPIFTIPCTVDSYYLQNIDGKLKYKYVKRSLEERYNLIYEYLSNELQI